VTPKQIYRATWIPHPVPAGDRVELIAPWIVEEPVRRILTAVRIDKEYFILSSQPDGTVMECWKVLLT